MKKHDKIFKKYLVTLTLILCLFGLCAGVTEAANKTSRLTKGETEDVITETAVNDYLTKKFADVFTIMLELSH